MHDVKIEDFSGIDFGDIRREKRFVTLINNISSQPGSSIPNLNKDWYDVKATYEFFKNKEVSLEALKKVESLYGSKQVEEQMQLLVVHDISTISFNHLQAEGLGYLANKEGRGILCYSSLAVSTQGLPMSLLYQHTWVRPLHELGKASKRSNRSFEDKESHNWYSAMREVNDLLGSQIQKIHIADREADIYELFFNAYEPNTDLLIRAKHNRKTEKGPIWDLVASHPAAATVSLELPDPSGKKKQTVEAELRYQPVKILRPARSQDKYESVLLTAIEVREKSVNTKNREDVLHWKLLTTLDIGSVSEALKCVKWYTYRWLIERFHYVLKSGTKIEELQLKQAASLQKAIIVYSMAAFRIMQLVYKARHYPKLNCELVLTPTQWKVLYILIHKKKEVPIETPTLLQVVMWIGKLGGHLGRKSDGPPGLKTVWIGYQHLCKATNLYEIAT
jgi:hypothetical protein